ncbi:Retrotransposon gag protein [Abeliophyllum distichum]|uniref:Retrotransposon gag protein n=1 Tax=Abeliophyllum distichum TaxID=126358 RepID=A0ABD1UMY4_9LAMI
MEKYDGSSHHVDHLRTFVDLMRLQASPDVIMCRAFLPTLSSKRAKKTVISLMQLTQDKDELMKDFIARFNRATLGIKNLQMSAIVTAMMSRTRSRPFKMSLSKNPPDTMH